MNNVAAGARTARRRAAPGAERRAQDERRRQEYPGQALDRAEATPYNTLVDREYAPQISR